MQLFSNNRKLVRILIITGSVLTVLAVGTMFWLSRHLTRLIETALQKNLGPQLLPVRFLPANSNFGPVSHQMLAA